MPKELRGYSRRMHWSHGAYSDGLVDRCCNGAKEDERQTKKMAGKRGGLVHVALSTMNIPSRSIQNAFFVRRRLCLRKLPSLSTIPWFGTSKSRGSSI